MPARKFSSRSALLLWSFLTIILMVLWSALLVLNERNEQTAVAKAEGDAKNLAHAFAEHTRASFLRVDYVAQDLRRIWLEAPDQFAAEVVQYQQRMQDIAFQLAVIGADGRLDFSNLSRSTERIDLSDREHFKAVRDAALRGEDSLFVSRPLKGRVSGKWSIQIVRPIFGKRGFAGALVISVDPAFFSRFYTTVDLGKHGVVTMVRDTGEILSRAPNLEVGLGRVLNGNSFFSPEASESGTFRRHSQTDGEDRIYGFRRLPEYRVTLVVGVGMHDVLQSTRIHFRWQLGGTLAISLVLLLLALAIHRRNQEQTNAQMALANSEARLRSVYELLPIGITVTDPTGRIIDCNRSAQEILGLDRESLLARSAAGEPWDIIRPDGTPMPPDEYASVRALRSGQPVFDVEMGVQRDNGERRWLKVNAMPADGGGIVIAYDDITERKQHQQQIAASEQRFRTLFESFSDIVFVIDTSGHLAMAHLPHSEWLAGIDADPWLGKELAAIFPPDIVTRIDAALADVLASGKPSTVDFRHAFAGTMRDYRANVSPLRGDTDWPEGFVLVARDITNERLAAESQRIAAKTFESQEGMMVTDERGIILRVNRAFTELTGYDADEVVGRNPSLLKSGRHEPDFYRNMWSHLVETGFWQGEVWNRRKSGELYPEWLTISAVSDEQGRTTHYVGSFSDISERKEAETQIRNLAFYDPLTNLPNRRLMLDRLQQALAAGQRLGRHGALIYLDLDHFKMLNDTRGHDAGDELLVLVAARLVATVREEDTVARLGGDEFVVMLEALDGDLATAAGQAGAVAEKIREKLAEPFALKGGDYALTPSLGISLFLGHEVDTQTLLKQADLALYEAKEGGRNTYRFFSHAMQEAVTLRAGLLAGLRRAIEDNEFELFLQPQIDADGVRLGAEALLRWHHPERGLVLPDQFIPLAEDSGLIVPIGLIVLDRACAILADWQHEGRRDVLSINVSARQFHHGDFADSVAAALTRHGVDGNKLCLELTESAVLADVDSAAARMDQLKSLGILISLDDFGTGYSSLSCLKRLPIDEVKIDRSFVENVTNNPQDAEIVHAIIVMCRSLGMTVIAEGVETEDQHAHLRACGCDAFQGYLFGRPAPVRRDDVDAVQTAG